MTAVAEFVEMYQEILSKTIPNYIGLDRFRLVQHDVKLEELVPIWENRIRGFASRMRDFIEKKVRPVSPQMVELLLRQVDYFVDEYNDTIRRIPDSFWWDIETTLHPSWTGADREERVHEELLSHYVPFDFSATAQGLIQDLRRSVGMPDPNAGFEVGIAPGNSLKEVRTFIGDYTKAAEIDEDIEREAERQQRKKARDEEAKKRLSGGFRSAYRQARRPYRVSFF